MLVCQYVENFYTLTLFYDKPTDVKNNLNNLFDAQATGYSDASTLG